MKQKDCMQNPIFIRTDCQQEAMAAASQIRLMTRVVSTRWRRASAQPIASPRIHRPPPSGIRTPIHPRRNRMLQWASTRTAAAWPLDTTLEQWLWRKFRLPIITAARSRKASTWTKTAAPGNTTLPIAIRWTFSISNNMVGHRASKNTPPTSRTASPSAASTITLWMIVRTRWAVPHQAKTMAHTIIMVLIQEMAKTGPSMINQTTQPSDTKSREARDPAALATEASHLSWNRGPGNLSATVRTRASEATTIRRSSRRKTLSQPCRALPWGRMIIGAEIHAQRDQEAIAQTVETQHPKRRLKVKERITAWEAIKSSQCQQTTSKWTDTAAEMGTIHTHLERKETWMGRNKIAKSHCTWAISKNLKNWRILTIVTSLAKPWARVHLELWNCVCIRIVRRLLPLK